MRKNFQETIAQKTDEELMNIAKDFSYSVEERLVAIAEQQKRKPNGGRPIAFSAKSEKKVGLSGMQIGGLIFTSFLYLMLIFSGIADQNMDSRDVITHSGVVASIGITYIPDNRLPRYRPVFYIRFEGERQHFDVFRRSGNYDDLLASIRPGDQLTILSQRDRVPDRERGRGIEAIQITRRHETILHISEFQNRQRAVIPLGILGLLANVAIFIWLLKKHKKKEKNEVENYE